MTDEIELAFFEILFGMLVFFMVGNSPGMECVQHLNLKALFDVRLCMLMKEN